MWYLIVSFPNLCTLTYLYTVNEYIAADPGMCCFCKIKKNQAECYDYRLTSLSTREIDDMCVVERDGGRGLCLVPVLVM